MVSLLQGVDHPSPPIVAVAPGYTVPAVKSDKSPISPRDPAIERKVDAEMSRLLYRSAGFGLFSNFVLAVVLVVATFTVYPASLHVPWLSAILGVSTGRFLLNLAFNRAHPPLERIGIWRNAFIAGVAVSGLLWGIAVWLYFETDLFMPRFLLLVMQIGLNGGAARSLGAVPRTYAIYAATTLVPVLVKFVALSDGGWALALVTMAYAMFLLNTAMLQCTDRRRLWHLIFENEALVSNLNQEKERAEAASQAKNDFLATMSHEIRTPMNGVIGMLQVLDQSPLNSNQKTQIEIASGSAEMLLRLLNDILDFSKIESGKLDFESITFALPQTIKEVASLLGPRAAEKELQFMLVMGSDLHEYVVGDAIRLKQVLLNLAGNAIKFTEKGRVEMSVTVDARNAQTVKFCFTVNDTGIDIDSEDQAQLFQMFSQGDISTTRRFGGTGLGLAISQKLVNRMGGHIQVESVKGIGSEFSFVLPMPISATPAAPARPAVELGPQLNGRVLIVEDEHANQNVIKLLIEGFGLQCGIVGDGASAVEVATLDQWDAVLMDCRMPGMDGLEATRRIRQKLAG